MRGVSCFVAFHVAVMFSQLNAQYPFKAIFKVVDGYSDLAMSNFSIAIIPENGTDPINVVTDSLGCFILSSVGRYSSQRFYIEPKDDRFVNSYFDKNSDQVEITVYCYPSDSYELEIARWEDEKYGSSRRSPNMKLMDSMYIEPSFPGGLDSLRCYIARNVIYPPVCLENRVEGKVIIHYVLEVDGRISHLTCADSENADLVREAKRLLRRMPKWEPAVERSTGESLRLKMYMPINFKIYE